jgi:hypothetical protein
LHIADVYGVSGQTGNLLTKPGFLLLGLMLRIMVRFRYGRDDVELFTHRKLRGFWLIFDYLFDEQVSYNKHCHTGSI